MQIAFQLKLYNFFLNRPQESTREVVQPHTGGHNEAKGGQCSAMPASSLSPLLTVRQRDTLHTHFNFTTQVATRPSFSPSLPASSQKGFTRKSRKDSLWSTLTTIPEPATRLPSTYSKLRRRLLIPSPVPSFHPSLPLTSHPLSPLPPLQSYNTPPTLVWKVKKKRRKKNTGVRSSHKMQQPVDT